MSEERPEGNEPEQESLLVRARREKLARRPQRIRRAGAVVALVVALVAALVGGARLAEIGPFDIPRYCWDAWEPSTNPVFLDPPSYLAGDVEHTDHGTAPSPEEPRGECTVTASSDYGHTNVTVTYDRPPASLDGRADWLAEFAGADSVPLPAGLPGQIGNHRGLLALPDACDVDGQPTFVTLTAGPPEEYDGMVLSPTRLSLGGITGVAELLVAAANRGMAATGCQGTEPMALTAAWPGLPEEEETVFGNDDDACRIPGLTFDVEREDPAAEPTVDYQVGAVTDAVQSCALTAGLNLVQPDLLLMMMAQSWLTDVFDDHVMAGAEPPDGWRGPGRVSEQTGIVRADCGARPAVFLMRGDPGAVAVGEDTVGSFATFVNAVAHRLGCPPVAPAE